MSFGFSHPCLGNSQKQRPDLDVVYGSDVELASLMFSGSMPATAMMYGREGVRDA